MVMNNTPALHNGEVSIPRLAGHRFIIRNVTWCTEQETGITRGWYICFLEFLNRSGSLRFCYICRLCRVTREKNPGRELDISKKMATKIILLLPWHIVKTLPFVIVGTFSHQSTERCRTDRNLHSYSSPHRWAAGCDASLWGPQQRVRSALKAI